MKLRGVNLGGWLVAEKWLSPSLFEGIEGNDEYSLVKSNPERLKKHHQEFMTQEDLKYLKKIGIKAVRVPVGFWVFGDYPPFISSIERVDWLMEETKKLGIQVIIDLHAVSGSQNGHNHSGKEGEIAWHLSQENINITLEIIKKLTLRYGAFENLYGIEILNEPSSEIPYPILSRFYLEAYQKIRVINENLNIILHDSFKPEVWADFSKLHNLHNVVLDLHLYQVFSQSDKEKDIFEHLDKTVKGWKGLIERLQEDNKVIIGEWSLGLDAKSLEGLDDFEKELAIKAFASTQLLVFERTEGWFFWNYKTANMLGWSFIDSIKKGYLPESYYS